MCILFIQMCKQPARNKFRLVLSANRDVYYGRPSVPADFWPTHRNVVGGMDMLNGKEGGSWLAMSTDGKIGIVLNILGQRKDDAAKGRGQFVSDFVTGSYAAKDYVEKISTKGNDYSGFHLLAINMLDNEIHHVTNVGSEDERKPHKMEGKVHAVGNSGLRSPFKKVLYGRNRFESIVSEFGTVKNTEELITNLLSLLKSEERHYPDSEIERLAPATLTESRQQPYSAVFAKIPDMAYGTRTHTTILIDYNWKVDFREWTMEEPISDFDNPNWLYQHKKFNVNCYTSSK